jgi:hypothetical protein
MFLIDSLALGLAVHLSGLFHHNSVLLAQFINLVIIVLVEDVFVGFEWYTFPSDCTPVATTISLNLCHGGLSLLKLLLLL